MGDAPGHTAEMERFFWGRQGFFGGDRQWDAILGNPSFLVTRCPKEEYY